MERSLREGGTRPGYVPAYAHNPILSLQIFLLILRNYSFLNFDRSLDHGFRLDPPFIHL